MKKTVLLAIASLFMVHCSGSGSSSFSSIGDLPRLTNPVTTDGANATSSLQADLAVNAIIGDSETGLNFYNATQSSFTQGDSRAACESFTTARDLMHAAAQADTILCYVQNVMAAPENDGKLDEDIYNGEYHTLTLDFAGTNDDNDFENNEAPKVKFKVEQDSDGNITEFEMFMCFAGTTSQPEQSEYIQQLINGQDRKAHV